MRTIEHARRMVLAFSAAQLPRDEDIVQKTAEHIVKTGDCVWHAMSQVTGKDCWCAKCKPTFGMHR